MTQESKIFPYITRLLQGAEVVWKPLGEVVDFQNGFAFKSNLFRDDGEAIVRITNIDGKSVDLSDVKYFSISDYSTNMSPYKINKGDILIAMSGATTGKIGFYNYEYTSYLNQRVGKFIPKPHILNNRYLYHYLLSKVEDIYIIAGGGAQPNLSSNKLMEKIQIPLPPLSVQQEIVRILDNFTTLEAELEAELDCRKRQYEYYRDKLLSFNMLNRGGQKLNNITIMALGEIAEYSQTRIGSSYLCETSYVGVDNLLQNRGGKTISTHMPKGGNLTAYQIGDVLIGNIRPYLRKIWYADNNGGASGDVLVIHLKNEEITPRYLYHILADDRFFAYNMQCVKGAKMPRGNKQKIMEYKIPVPSLEEQYRIVSILDKFDTLTHSISEGLPREIELRKKQYEYYREQLLSFPKT